MANKNPGIGIAAHIIKDDKLLLGLRKNVNGAGFWSVISGHIEFGENFEETVKREIAEEIGIEYDPEIILGTVSNDIFPEKDLHYIIIHFVVKYVSGKVKNLEPEKLERWEWFEKDHLPENLFAPVKELYAKGFNPWEIAKTKSHLL